MTPEALRKLASEATPGPWRQNSRDLTAPSSRSNPSGFLGVLGRKDDAALAALAPSLALLCAELGEALAVIEEPMHFDLEDDRAMDRAAMQRIARAALAKLKELGA